MDVGTQMTFGHEDFGITGQKKVEKRCADHVLTKRLHQEGQPLCVSGFWHFKVGDALELLLCP